MVCRAPGLALVALALSACVGVKPVSALDNGLARLPPMGWRSWEAYYGGVDQKKMLATMDALTERTHYTDALGAPCTPTAKHRSLGDNAGRNGGEGVCKLTSLADLGFSDAGLDAGFEDCGSRTVNGMPAFHDAHGKPLIDKRKFPDIGSMVSYGHVRNLTVSWYGNACACHSENSYTNATEPTVAQAIAGTVAATIQFKFDGLKLDSCSQFNNMTQWAQEFNRSGYAVLLENCHQGGLVPGQVMPGQQCTGRGPGASDCPYHVFRTSDDIYNHWEQVVNNINSVTPYLSSGGDDDDETAPRSRPGAWGYPDMLEVGNLGCPTGKSCNQSRAPIEDRSQFGMWAIVSAPLVLSTDLTNRAAIERVWPILSNKEVIAVNQHWNGSPGQLLLTAEARWAAPPSERGFVAYPAVLGQSRGWQNVMGMTGPPSWQVGPCIDEWTGGPCETHYMTLGGGPRNMSSVEEAEVWCAAQTDCAGFTFHTAKAAAAAAAAAARRQQQQSQSAGATSHSPTPAQLPVYFRDATQIFFMDSQIKALQQGFSGGSPTWTSHVMQSRAAPLSPQPTGLQVWVKRLKPHSQPSDPPSLIVNADSQSRSSHSPPEQQQQQGDSLALLLVNLGNTTLAHWSLPTSKLPRYFNAAPESAPKIAVRDLWNHRPYTAHPSLPAQGSSLEFTHVAAHDSVFLLLRPLSS